MVTIYKKDHVKRKYARPLVTKVSMVTCFLVEGALHGYQLVLMFFMTRVKR